MPEVLSIYITVPSREMAEKISRALVEERLAACVNILPAARSIFRWKGKVSAATEIILIAKTRKALYARLEKRVKDLHSYDCPCIVAWPIEAGFAPYLDWIAEETSD